MPIIGSIIKAALDLKDQLTPESHALAEQPTQLRRLLERARYTQFGKQYKFDEILMAEDVTEAFAQAVPYHDYNKINQEWWYRIHEGESNITWPGRPSYFARSSGTTGKTSKLIPVTDEMIEAIRLAGIQQISALPNFNLPPEFFEKEIMMLGSSTNLQERGDALEGEISGISASRIPAWFRGYYKPGEEIAGTDDWDERVQKIAERAADWDIGALSGIPSWIELMLQKVIAHHNLETIHNIWPNLQVYTSGGVAFPPYEKSFNALLKHPITVIDTYLASEGFLAFQQRPETTAMKLITDNGIYFEFVPFKPEFIQEDGSLSPQAPSISLAEVEEGIDYVLLISTVSGLWRYVIGDTICFTDTQRYEIKITGRTKFFLNVVGSQLSVNKMQDALLKLEEEFNIKIPEFTVAAKRMEDGEFYHVWYLGTIATEDGTKLAEALDRNLKTANKNYAVARSKALRGVKVHTVSPTVFHEWSGSQKKKGGQVKMEKVMGEEKFMEWEEFVRSLEKNYNN
jgi:hypothetical protein